MRMRNTGFTLNEILLVLAIMLVLLGILIPVILMFKTKAKNLSSKSMLTVLIQSLNRYKMQCGSYPIKPSGHSFDGVTPADFYQIPCAPLGQPSNGTEDNVELVALLQRTCHFDPAQQYLKNGRLVDDFGSPVIVRFLTVNTGSFPEVRVYAWSYGQDRKNGVDAASTYSFTAGPAYDQAEVNKINASIDAGPDDPYDHQ